MTEADHKMGVRHRHKWAINEHCRTPSVLLGSSCRFSAWTAEFSAVIQEHSTGEKELKLTFILFSNVFIRLDEVLLLSIGG